MLWASTEFDVTERLRMVEAPTLVFQSIDGTRVSMEQARSMAGRLPNARLIEIDSRNHILMDNEAGWWTFVSELRSFCATPVEDLAAVTNSTRDTYGLSARELEVIALIAAGRSDREIAGALGISVRTASNHVKSILQKSVSVNRAQAVAWAAKRDLI